MLSSDGLGRDLLTRLIYGGRLSLFMSLSTLSIIRVHVMSNVVGPDRTGGGGVSSRRHPPRHHPSWRPIAGVPPTMTDHSLEAFLALARQAGLEFTEDEVPRMHDGWRRMQSMLLSRLPADPELTDEPALVFLATGAGIAR